jgi:hypothetical protein
MSDFNSSLPVRTENPGDVAVFLVDGTTPTQKAAVDANGSLRDVVDGPVSPGSAAAFSALIGGQFNTTLPTLTTGQQAALQVDNRGRLLVTPSVVNDTNYGVVGANTLRTAAQIGNATGAADFNYGTVGAQTLRAAAQIGNATGAADFGAGSATAQTLRVTISNFPTTLDTNYGTVGANTLRTASQIGNATGAADFNVGAIGAQTLRVAAEIANATGLADFNAGATGAQTLRVVANQGAPNTAANAWPISITSGGAANSPTNPIFVSEAVASGTPVDNYNTVSALAANATSTHVYTVTAGKTFFTKQFWASGSGKLKVEVQYETAAGSGIFNSFWVGFNSTSTPNIPIPVPSDKTQIAGAKIQIIRTNLDKASQDVYSTISGNEQ